MVPLVSALQAGGLEMGFRFNVALIFTVAGLLVGVSQLILKFLLSNSIIAFCPSKSETI